MRREILLVGLMGLSLIFAQQKENPIEQESWLFQLLTRLKSSNPKIVRSAQEALFSYGPSIRTKLLPYQKDPQLGPPIEELFKRFEDAGLYHLDRAIRFSPKERQILLKSFLEPLSLNYEYEQEYFLEKTIEVLPLTGENQKICSLVQNVWIHYLDQSNYFTVLEPKITQNPEKAAIQIGGKINWIFIQGNARLQFDLWIEAKGLFSKKFKQILVQQGNNELQTALQLIEPQVSQWVKECLPKKQQIVLNFFPPTSRPEWFGILMAKEGRYQEAYNLMKVVETDSQKFNLALILEILEKLEEASKIIDSIKTKLPESQILKQRLTERLRFSVATKKEKKNKF